MARNDASVRQHKQSYTRDYRYSVVWSEEDDAFIGRVLEFPSLPAHGSTQSKALSEIQSLVQHAFEDLKDSGEEVPEPASK